MSPPETIVFADSIQWLGSSQIEGNQHQYAENIDTTDITNYGLLEQLTVGQSIACKIKINGELEVLPLFLAKYQRNVSATISSQQYEAKGTTVLSDGKIAGVIFDYDIFKGDYTDTSVITDDIAISSVRFTGKTSPAYVYFINYDELNTFMGVAVDAGGNFGPVWREAVTLTPEGASPASEYPF